MGEPRVTHQGFLASFSTSALLVGAALSILLVVSTVVAFEGWPGPTADTSTETFVLKDARATSAVRGQPDLVLEPPPPPRDGDEGGTGGAGAAAGAGAASTGSVRAPAPTPEAAPPTEASPPEATVEAPTAPATGDATVPTGEPAPTRSLGGTVDDAIGAIEGGADAIAPVTGPVGGLAGGTAESVTRTIDGSGLR